MLNYAGQDVVLLNKINDYNIALERITARIDNNHGSTKAKVLVLYRGISSLANIINTQDTLDDQNWFRNNINEIRHELMTLRRFFYAIRNEVDTIIHDDSVRIKRTFHAGLPVINDLIRNLNPIPVPDQNPIPPPIPPHPQPIPSPDDDKCDCCPCVIF